MNTDTLTYVVIKSLADFKNIMKLHNISDDNVETDFSDTYFISINNPDDEETPFKKEHFNVLTLRFDDTENENNTVLKPITDEQCNQIVSFLTQLKDKKAYTLLVHCTMGRSRSVGVAVFASEFLGISYQDLNTWNRGILTPNVLVLNKLRKLTGLSIMPDVYNEL